MKKINFNFHILALILLAFVSSSASNIESLPDFKRHEEFLKNRKDNKAIYLAINVNINSFNDWCPPKEGVFHYSYSNVNRLNHKLGIYLGKIVFEKEHNKLIPKYIPTSIENLEQELEKINPLWLNELNKNYTPPLIETIGPTYKTFYKTENLKIQCKIEKNTIVLTKEQALSYIREIHTQNTQIIQAYIDEILKNYGLKPYVFTDEFYDELGELGIITPRQVEGFKKNRLIQEDELKLTMLDYLAKQNRKNEDYIITFDDELFYRYLFVSLRSFVLVLSQGAIQDRLNLLFNPAAYIDDTKFNYEDLTKEITTRYSNELKELNLFKTNYYGKIFLYNGFFQTSSEGGRESSVSLIDYFPREENLTWDWGTPNKNMHTPSVLGKFYFYLITTNYVDISTINSIYLELIQPYYPTNPPKAWTKEMMKKLDLKLE